MKNRRLFRIAIICITIVLLTFLFLQVRAKSAVQSFLDKKFPAHIALHYDDIDVNLLAGKVQFSAINIKIRDRDTTLNHTLITVDQLTVDGLSYWQFFFDNTIKASQVSVETPRISYYPSKTFRKESDTPKGVVNLLKDIAIEKIAITNGSFNMAYTDNDSTQVSARSINFSLLHGETGPKIIKQKIPLTYEDYEFSAEELFVNLGSFETVTASKLMITDTDAVLKNLVLKSKYSKDKLSRQIRKERDHINLRLPVFSIRGIDFGFNENRFFFNSRYTKLENLNLDIYRDKMVPDDRSKKRMYSTVLRELPFDLNIDSLAVLNSKVIYQENTKKDTKAGSLFFDDLSLKLKNISNTYSKGNETTAHVAGKLMGVSPISVLYSFDMNDVQDAFTLSTTVHDLNGELVNSFLRPNLNTLIEGQVNELYSTTTGNRYIAKGDMKMKYKDLKFEILKKDRLRINKVLSAIGNLFINDGSNADAQGYRYGSIDVERDPTKTFFNYIWISTQDGLLSTLTGNGKKRDQ